MSGKVISDEDQRERRYPDDRGSAFGETPETGEHQPRAQERNATG
jgi:hypothetical protein